MAGNIRQLENVIYQAMIITDSNVIDAKSLPSDVNSKKELKYKKINNDFGQGAIINNKESIRPFEESVKETLQRALNLTNGDIPETAERLNLSRSSFYRMVQKYGLTKPVS